MNDLLDRIQASVEAERRFIDDASHELRTPLSILKAELDLALARERSPDELRAALRSAAEETDHLVRLAEDLLVLARAHGGRLPVRGDADGSPAAARGIAGRHQPRATEAGVAIDVDAPSTHRVRGSGPAAAGDRRSPGQRRALHAARGGRHGRGIGRRRHHPLCASRDSGPGFSADVLSRAFEPFVADPDAEREGRGRLRPRSRDRPRHRRRSRRIGPGGEHARRRRTRHDDDRGAHLTSSLPSSSNAHDRAPTDGRRS